MSEHIVYVRIVNRWSTPISGSVTHVTAGSHPSIVRFQDLPVQGVTPELAIVTRGIGLDYWSYVMQDASYYTRSGQLQCSIDQADDGGLIDCVFEAQQSELRIVMPASASCASQMEGYVGFMQVRNSFEMPISGWVMHQTTDFGATLISFEDLKKGEETSAMAIASSAASLDRWHYEITLDGVVYRGVHKCGFGQEYRTLTAILEFCVPREETIAIRSVMPDFNSCFTRLARKADDVVVSAH